MSAVAARELEEDAKKYASEAIRMDSQGAHGMAIQMYQKAISTLIRLVHVYPEYKLNRQYMDRAMAYQERVKAIQQAHGLLPRDEQTEDSSSAPTLSTPSGNGHGHTGDSTSKGPQMVQQLKATFNELVIREKPNVHWDDVIGLDDAKRAIRESVVFPFERPDLFPLGWPRGILLYGPPGCGKTMLAAATAAEIKGYFISIDAATIMSKWLGEAEKNVAKLFNEARKLLDKGDPVIVFIDEIDSLLGSRSNEVGGEVRVRNQFLKEMDGIQDKGKHVHLYTVGATNKPWGLDWPFLRRFEKRIYVPLPNLESRMAMFRSYTAPLHVDSSIGAADLAKIAEGYSGSDVRDMCQAVQLRVVSELFESGMAVDKMAQPRPIVLNDFKEVLKVRRPSVSLEMLRAYVNWSEQFKAL